MNVIKMKTCSQCKKITERIIIGLCINCYSKKRYKEGESYRIRAKLNATNWKRKHPEKNYQYTKNWVNNNRERYNALIMDNYYKNKDKWKERHLVYYNKNKDKYLEYYKEYREKRGNEKNDQLPST